MNIKHPDILYRSDLGGIKLTIGQAVKMKKIQKCRAWPDFFIAEPHYPYCGLFIEFKKNRSEVYTKENTIRNNKHIQEQYRILLILSKKGYKAVFGCGFYEITGIVNNYLSLPKPSLCNNNII